MKKLRLIENAMLLLSANLAWFVSTYYQHRADGSYSAADVIFDILYIVIATWFLMIVFFKNKTVFSLGAFSLQENKRTVLLKCFSLIGIKCATDVALWAVGLISIEFKYIVGSLLSAAFWLIGYAVFVKKEDAVWTNARHTVVLGGAIAAVLVIGACYDIHLTKQAAALFEKYSADSPYLARALANMDFCSTVKAFIADSIVLLVLIVYHSWRAPIAAAEEEKTQGFIHTFIRCGAIGFAFVLLAFGKTVIDEQSFLVRAMHPQFFLNETEKKSQFIKNTTQDMVLYGFGVEPSDEVSYYFTETVVLKKSGCKPEEFCLNGKEPNFIFLEDGEQGLYCTEFVINKNPAYVYGQYAICLIESGIGARIVRMDSLGEYARSDGVIELCCRLLENGNLFVFEYGAEYLSLYAPEFIEPFIERYRAGDFNERELRWLEQAHYRSDYIVNIAKKVS